MKTSGPLQPLRLKPLDSLKLMDGVRSLEIGYFDARLNGWMDRWTDAQTLPNLVRLRLTTEERSQPYEIVVHVPGGGLTRVDSLLNIPGLNAGGLNTTPATGGQTAPPSYVPPNPPSFVPRPPPGGVPQPPPNAFGQGAAKHPALVALGRSNAVRLTSFVMLARSPAPVGRR